MLTFFGVDVLRHTERKPHSRLQTRAYQLHQPSNDELLGAVHNMGSFLS